MVQCTCSEHAQLVEVHENCKEKHYSQLVGQPEGLGNNNSGDMGSYNRLML